jgi:hypothetical protein
MNRAVAFEVESTVETAGHAYVLARLLDPGTNVEAPPGTTPGDRAKFVEGERVLLRRPGDVT